MIDLPRGVYVDFRRTPDGWRAELRFKLTDGQNQIRVSGDDAGLEEHEAGPGAALARAAAVARMVTENPLMANVLPPGSVAAVSAARALAKAAKRGILDRPINGKPLYQHFTGAWRKLATGLRNAARGGGGAPPQLAGGPLQLADGRSERGWRADRTLGCPR